MIWKYVIKIVYMSKIVILINQEWNQIVAKNVAI